MSDFSSEDGWGFSLLSHHFRADDSDGADEGDVADAKNTLSNDNDLDLASRPDEAQFKANPWSIAKVNAASRPQQHRESIDQAPKLTSVSSAVGASKSRGQKNAAKKQTRLKQTFFTKGKSCLQDDAIISSTQTHTPSLCVSRATPASVNADDAREKRLQAIHYALNSDDSPPAVISSPYPKFATPTAAVDHLQSTPNDLNAQPHTASGPAFDVASAHTAAPSSPVILPNTYPDHDVIISLPGRDPRSPVPATVAAVSPPPPEAYPPYHREPFFDRNVFSSSQASRDIFAVQIPRHQALLVTHTDDERFILHTPGLGARLSFPLAYCHLHSSILKRLDLWSKALLETVSGRLARAVLPCTRIILARLTMYTQQPSEQPQHLDLVHLQLCHPSLRTPSHNYPMGATALCWPRLPGKVVADSKAAASTILS
jgi:hypothetical protein